MERDAIMEERRLTAAIAAALLGQQGSPVWTRAAEPDRRAAVGLLDAIDRARLNAMDVLLLLHVAEDEATVADLAAQLDRRPADVRRATARLVARGLLRRRSPGT